MLACLPGGPAQQSQRDGAPARPQGDFRGPHRQYAASCGRLSRSYCRAASAQAPATACPPVVRSCGPGRRMRGPGREDVDGPNGSCAARPRNSWSAKMRSRLPSVPREAGSTTSVAARAARARAALDSAEASVAIDSRSDVAVSLLDEDFPEELGRVDVGARRNGRAGPRRAAPGRGGCPGAERRCPQLPVDAARDPLVGGRGDPLRTCSSTTTARCRAVRRQRRRVGDADCRPAPGNATLPGRVPAGPGRCRSAGRRAGRP